MTSTDANCRADLVGGDRRGFVASVFALVMVFASAGATIPVFNIFRQDEGFTNGGIAITVVAYSIGSLGALLVLGRLSNHVGRRPTAIASLGMLIVGCVILLDVHHLVVLVAGRLVMGVGAGLASSSLTSYVIDTAPPTPPWLASVASSQTVMLGLAVGAVLSGALVQFCPWPRDLVFLVAVGLLALSIVLVARSAETVTPLPGAWSSLRPRIFLPASTVTALPAAASVFLATWAVGAFYQAFVPALVKSQLHSDSPLVVGVVFAAYMASSALGAPLSGRFSPAAAQRLGMGAFQVGMTGVTAAVATGALVLFIVATVLAGASQGIAISAATRALLAGSSVAARASIFSVIYLLCYAGATVPALIAGRLSSGLSLPHIAVGYGVLTLVSAVVTLSTAREHRASS